MSSFSTFGGQGSFQSAAPGNRGSTVGRGGYFQDGLNRGRGQAPSNSGRSNYRGGNHTEGRPGGESRGLDFQTRGFQQARGVGQSRGRGGSRQSSQGYEQDQNTQNFGRMSANRGLGFQAPVQGLQTNSRGSGQMSQPNWQSSNPRDSPDQNQRQSSFRPTRQESNRQRPTPQTLPQSQPSFQSQTSFQSGGQTNGSGSQQLRTFQRPRDSRGANGRVSRENTSQSFAPRGSFNDNGQNSNQWGGRTEGKQGDAPDFSSNIDESHGHGQRGSFRRPNPRDTRNSTRDNPETNQRGRGAERGRGDRGRGGRGRGDRAVSRGDNSRGRGRGRGDRGQPRGAKVSIMNRIKVAGNQDDGINDELSDRSQQASNEESYHSGSQDYSEEYYSGEDDASYSRDKGNSHSRSYSNDDGYQDYKESRSPSPPALDRGKPLSLNKVMKPLEKPKISLLSRIKPISTIEEPKPQISIQAKQRPAMPPPPPPPRPVIQKERIKKSGLELPGLQRINRRVSLRDGEGTPHNKEVSSSLLAKVDRFNENDIMTRKYRLYLQKRKKNCLNGPRELINLVSKFEKLDFEKTSCFGMCPQLEIMKRQENQDIDIFERTDNLQVKQIKPEFAIKKFTRSSADQLLDIPELLRPVFILAKTLEHIFSRVIDDDSKETSQFIPPRDGRPRVEYLDIYLYVGDRLRSVKQDIQILSSHCPEIFCSKIVITIYEQIVRFYIISGNELLNKEGYDPRINLEQLSAAFTSLIECYRLSRKNLPKLYTHYQG